MLNIGFILDDKYEIIKVLGRGGMGTVYLCKNLQKGDLWAVKEVVKNEALDIDILSEAKLLKKLKHPNIPKILDTFYKDDILYMVQDYIEGQTLKEYVLAKWILDPEEICRIASSLCDILTYLHNLKPAVIYRDLKPSNIMITPEGKVVLIDFGISKTYKVNKNSDTVVMGSNGYAAPEQRGLGQSCRQTDIYGIGMVMYFMANGRVSTTDSEPFSDESYSKNFNNDLKKIIQKCVKSHIKDRYKSAAELNRELMKYGNKIGLDKTMISYEQSIKPSAELKNHRPWKALSGFLIIIVFIFSTLYFFNLSINNASKASSINKTNVDSSAENLPVEKKTQPAIDTSNNTVKNSNDIAAPSKTVIEQANNTNKSSAANTNINRKDHKGKDRNKKIQ